MNAQDLEQRARELPVPALVFNAMDHSCAFADGVCILTSRANFYSEEQFREAVECLCNGAGSMSSAEWARRDAERKRLLSIIDNAGKAACATCGGRGEVGGHTGQTPEQFEFVTEPCPDCQGDAYGSADAPTPLGRMLGVQPAPVVDAGNCIAADDVRRLTREIDVALNGEAGAAPQASLCDIAAQVKAEASKRGAPLLAAYDPNCGARTVRVVDDAMVKRAIVAYHDAGGAPSNTWAMRAALTAAIAKATGAGHD